ncbi:MAG: hypothetical protein QM786_13035 [Breznakibacter sp.]
MKPIFLTLIFVISTMTSVSAQWNGSNPVLLNDSTANVGIGTSEPNARLHIKGIGDQDLLLENATIGMAPEGSKYADLVLGRWEDYFLDLTNWGWGARAAATALRISANQTEGKEATLALVRGKYPNVEFLDLYNNGYDDARQFGIRIQKRGSGEYNDFVFDQYDGRTFSPLMVLKKNGNVGIGTNAPLAKLDVSGSIRATEIKVEAKTADFVFDEDYDLKPLAEVEQYIKEHKHLPNIPGAMEMESNGVDLAKMNMLLLQKVEELTLYLIIARKNYETLSYELTQLKSLLYSNK